MAREKAPAFQFYPRDWLSDPTQAAMCPAGAGAYVRLFCYCWLDHALPADDAALARLAGMTPRAWARVSVEVLAAFQRDGDTYRHGRLDRIRGEQNKWREKSTSGGSAKWHSGGGNEHKAKRSERLTDARLKGTHTKEEWVEMLAAYKVCLQCGGRDTIVKDHVIPIYQGGSDAITNLQPLCGSCNSSKGADTTDHRIGRPETVAKWLPNANHPQPECLPNAFSSARASSSSSSDVQTHTARATPIATGPHRSHAFCWTVCVPAFLHDEFRRKLNGDDQAEDDAIVRRFYVSVAENWPDGKRIGDTDCVFWRARWEEAVGTTVQPKRSYRPEGFR